MGAALTTDLRLPQEHVGADRADTDELLQQPRSRPRSRLPQSAVAIYVTPYRKRVLAELVQRVAVRKSYLT